MRLYEQIARPGARVASGAPVSPALVDRVRTSTRVVADDCARWFYLSDQWSAADHLGPLRPPYDSLWIEWRVPNGRDRGFMEQGGAWVSVEAIDDFLWEHEDMQGVRRHPQATLGVAAGLVCSGRKGLLCFSFGVLLQITDEGDLLASNVIGPAASGDRAPEIAASLVWPAMMAVSLMNCRNVTLAEVKAPPAVAKRHRRKHGVATLSHHVVKVPGASHSGSARHAGDGGDMPHHLVRGHFKTFTADAPLFGRKTGTYWWGWQARGSKRNGIVTKTYEAARP